MVMVIHFHNVHDKTTIQHYLLNSNKQIKYFLYMSYKIYVFSNKPKL